jgi:hypothetical protein
MDVGLPPSLRDEIRHTHARAVAAGRWTRTDGSVAYAGSNASEYFAELTMWYFGSRGEFIDSAARTPTPGPGGLAEHDPDGFRLLASIYGGTHAKLCEEDAPVGRLRLREASRSTGEEETESDEVAVEFDNRGCECAWKLYWLTPEGERMQYGEVPSDATHRQVTFRGHAWLLERHEAGGAGGGSRGGSGGESEGVPVAQLRELRYVAGQAAAAAIIKEDAGCRPLSPPPSPPLGES